MNQENILRILDEIEISISKIKNELNSKHELEPKEKYEELINKIKSIDDLKCFFNEDNECKGHIVRCIRKVKQYPFLNKYIDLYFKFNSDKINEQNELGYFTPLMYSLMDENIETSKIILKHSPNLELKEKFDNQTALFYACRIKNSDDLNNMIKLLLDMGADFNAINQFGQTPIFYLCKNISANIDTYKILLDKGININYKNKFNNTILNVFCLCNDENKPEIIDLFKQYGYNFTIHDIDFILETEKYTYLKQILSYYDNLDLFSNVNFKRFDNKPIKLIKVFYYLYCENKIDEEIIKLAISKGAKKEDLIDDKLQSFFNKL